MSTTVKSCILLCGLDKLLVEDLNKYLDHHNIDKAPKLKREKLHFREETRKK